MEKLDNDEIRMRISEHVGEQFHEKIREIREFDGESLGLLQKMEVVMIHDQAVVEE